MAEELRDYLLLRFSSVFSGYGATDIEIGMAGESPVSVALRRLVRAQPEIRAALFGGDSRLPLIFQHNPLIHWLEINDRREILTTISRLDVLAPRIRYNVHDQGGIMEFEAVDAVLKRSGRNLQTLYRDPDRFGPRGPLPWAIPLKLPFLWVHGRSDHTISVMGANLYPEDVEAVLYGDTEVGSLMHSFCMSIVSDSDGTPRPGIAIELKAGAIAPRGLSDRVAGMLLEGLSLTDPDYRSAVAEFPQAMLPVVSLFQKGLGPFEQDSNRIKQRRIVERF
jgi:phenylacetate-CoA ligase